MTFPIVSLHDQEKIIDLPLDRAIQFLQKIHNIDAITLINGDQLIMGEELLELVASFRSGSIK